MPRLARYQNHNYMFQALIARLSLEPQSERIADFRQQVLAMLAKRLD